MFEQQPHLFHCSLVYRGNVRFLDGLPQSANLVVILPVDRLRQRAGVIGSASFACHGATVTTVPLEGWRRASTSTVEDVRRLAGRPCAFRPNGKPRSACARDGRFYRRSASLADNRRSARSFA